MSKSSLTRRNFLKMEKKKATYVTLLTQDGKLVEIRSEIVDQAPSVRASNEDVRTWIKS